MKTWYFAKCDKCMEVKNFFVCNPLYTARIFGQEDENGNHRKSEAIQKWFLKHYGCELTLGWRDDHLDKLWEEGYTNADLT